MFDIFSPDAARFFFCFGLPAFAAAVLAGWLLVGQCRRLALRADIVDRPDWRKEQKIPVPLLGGVGVIGAFVLVLALGAAWHAWFAPGSPWWPADAGRALIGLAAGLGVIALAGYADDKRDLSWKMQLAWTAVAVAAVFAAGTRIEGVTHPLGGLIVLPAALGFAATVAWFWLMIFTTKVLDGVDGLLGGVTAAAALVVAGLTMTERWWQPGIGAVALAAAGAFVGFLVWNWHPARIYLGQAGSIAAGFLLAWLATVSGSKLLTATVVMLLPIMDFVWTILRRLWTHRSVRGVFKPDVRHLHHVLRRRGWGARRIVALYVLAGVLPGVISLFLSPLHKLFFIGAVVLLFMSLMARWYVQDEYDAPRS